MALLRVVPDDAEPPYAQIRRQIAQQVEDGVLVPGTRLPAVRRLAGDLGLAPNTVARAYRELEAAGVVRTAGRNGTLVASDAVAEGDEEEVVDAFIATMAGRGVVGESLLRMVQRRMSAREVRSASRAPEPF